MMHGRSASHLPAAVRAAPPSVPAAGFSLPVTIGVRLGGDVYPVTVRLNGAGKAMAVTLVGPAPADFQAAVCEVNGALGRGRRSLSACRSGMVGAVADVVRRCVRDHAPTVAMALAAVHGGRPHG